MLGGQSRYQPVLRFVRDIAHRTLACLDDSYPSFHGREFGIAQAEQP